MRLFSLMLAVGWMLLGIGRAPAETTPASMPSIPMSSIADFPPPIVGNADTTASGQFVYPDVIDLNLMISDDVTPPGALQWTYATVGASRYLINGIAPINFLTTSPINPPLASQINKSVVGGELNPDRKSNTITIRNKMLSPLGGATTIPSATGIIPSETQVVTFFCSDGASYTSETVFFFTDNGGSDRLSGSDPFRAVLTDKITTMWQTNPMEWHIGGTNNISRVRPSGGTTGVCLRAPLLGSNYGSLITSYPYFNLAANQVYRMRMKMSCSNPYPANMPYWSMLLENYETHTGNGLNLYIQEINLFSNMGAANALTPTPSIFTWYWTPPAVATPQWNNASTGAFTSARDAVNDPRLRFRVMDYSSATYHVGGGDSRSGDLCIHEVEIASTAISRSLATGSPLVSMNALADHGGPGGNVECFAFKNGLSSVIFSGGTLTISPVDPPGDDNGMLTNLTEIRPATDTTFSLDPANPASQDNFPIVWKTGKILRMQVGLSAPTAADEASPWDAYTFLFNTMTNEINVESFQTSNQGMGAPKMGTPQTYTMFFYTGNETKAPAPGYHRLRWQMRLINHSVANFPNGQISNTGAVRIHSIKVDEVIFK